MLTEHEYQIKQIKVGRGSGRKIEFAVYLPAPDEKAADLVLGKFPSLQQALRYRAKIEQENQ